MPRPAAQPLTTNQIRGFWAAWAGWALDGMDSFIYALVLVPALRDLLPRSGLAATQANIGFYGGVLFAIFLVGWGFAFLWGPLADRFGRVRTLVLTILCYSLFTFLGCAAMTVWQLAAFRFLAGVGIGGEWTIGGVFVAEEWPESRRHQGAAWMHTGYYFGTFLAAIVNYTVGAHYGWRAVFAVGGAPALLVAFIRYGVRESARWERRVAALDRRWTARARLLRALLPRVPPPHPLQRGAALHLHGRPLGRVGLRAFVRHLSRRAAKASPPPKPRASRPGPSCCSPPAPSSAASWFPPWPPASDAAARSPSSSS